MLVHVLRQPFRLPPVIMQTDRFLLFHLVRTVEQSRIHMSRSVPQLVLHLAPTDVLCCWVQTRSLDLVLLALALSADVLCFAQVFFLADQAFVFFVVLVACRFLEFGHVLALFVDAFVGCAK